MASTLIIAEDGKVYCVTLGDPGEVVELKSGDETYPERAATADAAQKMIDDGVHLADIPAPAQEGIHAAAAQIIMGTFVNLPLLGEKAD
ncbi:MAG TPA: hypothetical protein VGS22_04745 [Thermoanaerobaculia bacterium]|nr:hypothetical protein [Thermoanaerobaculia bacterium]